MPISMSLADEEIPPLRTPDSDPALEAAIGRCLISWGIFETRIDSAIDQMLRIESNISHAITANLGSGSKLTLFQALLHIWGSDVFEEKVIASADDLISRTGISIGKVRNFLAHGQVYSMFDNTGGEPMKMPDGSDMWVWLKVKARKGGVSGTMIKLTPDGFDEMSREINELNEEWHHLQHRLKDDAKLIDLMRKG